MQRKDGMPTFRRDGENCDAAVLAYGQAPVTESQAPCAAHHHPPGHHHIVLQHHLQNYLFDIVEKSTLQPHFVSQAVPPTCFELWVS